MPAMKKKPDSKAGKKSDIPVQPKKSTEKDADDLVHEENDEQPTDAGEKDLDDIVHRPYKTNAAKKEDSLEDPDHLVHDQGDIDDDE